MVELKLTVPSLVVLFVLMVTSAPKVTGPVRDTLLPETSAVVIFPFKVMPDEPVIVTDLISLAEPMAPTETVLVDPPEEVRVTVWLEVPRIVPIEIAPPPETTARLEPLANCTVPVLKLIAVFELVKVVVDPAFTLKLLAAV